MFIFAGGKRNNRMGQLAFIKVFMLVSIPTDINEQITRCFNGEKTIIKNIE